MPNKISREQLAELAENVYGDMIKGVVDIDKGKLALDEERWASISLMEQMANIGSEVGRTWDIMLLHFAAILRS
ncbi:MAG: DUF5674 family protein [Candidatus Cryptobacteroides sp.]